ncbi:MAG: recombination mediator RecR [Bacilli bacterium]|jgi:recombination protein RecR
MKELKSLERLIDSLAKLPSVGRKSAERMAYALLDMPEEDIKEFSDSLLGIKIHIKKCPVCGIYTEDDICEICKDSSRDDESLLVVSSTKDVVAFEKMGKYHGKYHVLGGVLSATQGVSVDNLNIDSLIKRTERANTKEVILATNPTIEGETTALYIAKLLEDKNIVVSRLAYGLPMGGHLDYADSLTLNRALEGRRKV